MREQDIECLENQADVEDESDEDEDDEGEEVPFPADSYFLWSLRTFGNEDEDDDEEEVLCPANSYFLWSLPVARSAMSVISCR